MDRGTTTVYADDTATGRRHTLSASSLIGDSIVNPEGETLGNLKELMIDVDSGRIAYGVLESGGFLGLGSKLFAIPFEAFRVDGRTEQLVLDVDKETLNAAEGFDADAWPDTTDPDFADRTHRHYGYGPYWERR